MRSSARCRTRPLCWALDNKHSAHCRGLLSVLDGDVLPPEQTMSGPPDADRVPRSIGRGMQAGRDLRTRSLTRWSLIVMDLGVFDP